MKQLILALMLAVSFSAQAVEQRSYSARAAFVKRVPCPATHEFTTVAKGCPGYVIDHVIPLCAGGLDSYKNMQWQERLASYKKDVQERKQCALLKT